MEPGEGPPGGSVDQLVPGIATLEWIFLLTCLQWARALLIPNRTFLVRFGGISGEFGRAMVRILARRSRAKIPMARPNEPDMPPKRTKKVRLGIYRTQIQPKIR